MDYTRVTSLESKGLRQYVHKYELGYQDYYFRTKYAKELALTVNAQWRADNPQEVMDVERTIREGIHKMKGEVL